MSKLLSAFWGGIFPPGSRNMWQLSTSLSTKKTVLLQYLKQTFIAFNWDVQKLCGTKMAEATARAMAATVLSSELSSLRLNHTWETHGLEMRLRHLFYFYVGIRGPNPCWRHSDEIPNRLKLIFTFSWISCQAIVARRHNKRVQDGRRRLMGR